MKDNSSAFIVKASIVVIVNFRSQCIVSVPLSGVIRRRLPCLIKGEILIWHMYDALFSFFVLPFFVSERGKARLQT